MRKATYGYSVFGKVIIYFVVGVMVLGMLAVSALSPVYGANPAATITQYANASIDWDTGNLGAPKAIYYEGDTIPYRIHLQNMTAGPHSLIIEWDTTKAGYHSIDYITGYNNTESPDPCLGLDASICTLPVNTFSIPVDPQVTTNGVTPIPGVLTLIGGTITGVGPYLYPDGPGYLGDKSAQIEITFTVPANVPDLILVWGGHISTREDWGFDQSAIMIQGSPYHMRLIGLDGSGGNQDRSLSASETQPDAAINKICVPAYEMAEYPYYRVVVTNSGPGSVYGAKITDTLPVGAVPTGVTSANLTIGGVASPAGSCTIAGQLVTCDLLEWIPSTAVDPTAKWTVDIYFNGVSLNYDDYYNTASLTTMTTDPIPGNNTSAPTACGSPAAVDLLGFSAAATGKNEVTLRWQAANERDHLGFNLYRASSENGSREKINTQLIRSAGTLGSTLGANYEYVDTVLGAKGSLGAGNILRQAKNGRVYFYWLEALDIHGKADLYGPVAAQLLNK